MADPSREALLHQVYHHVVLPRDVPDREDSKLRQVEAEINKRLLNATKQLALYAPPEDHVKLDTTRLMLATCSELNFEGDINKDILADELQQLEDSQALVLHVTEQNAALLIYQHLSDDDTKMVVFEAFETSATCEQVLASENALIWDFPGQSIAVPYTTFETEDFQQTLTAFLEQSSFEPIKQFAAVTTKATASLKEVRDTPQPTLITGALMAILEFNGVSHNSPLVRKRVRDTVSFHNAHKPWRRSPFYLVLRVAIQRHLYRTLGPDKGRLYFKTTMCIFLSTLLHDGLYVIPHDASHGLGQKLGSRLAKLEIEYSKDSERSNAAHRHIFDTLRPILEKSLMTASRNIRAEWETHTKNVSRIVRSIPHSARQSDLQLLLSTSGPVLNRNLQHRFSAAPSTTRPQEELLGHYQNNVGCKPLVVLLNSYLALYEYEENMCKVARPTNGHDDASQCIDYANKIEAYVSTIADAYSDYPEFRSRQLLNLMEMWKALDELAVECYPLLAEYHPGFDADIMNVLELSTLGEYERLYNVQLYIVKRCQGWRCKGSKTIFAVPAKDSYAVRAYDESAEAEQLRKLRENVEADAAILLANKKQEWIKASTEYDTKQRTFALKTTVCTGFTAPNKNGKTQHNSWCLFHHLKWKLPNMRIDSYEHPLPKPDPEAKAVIFELACPPAFAAYRDATWLILSSLARPQVDASSSDAPADEAPVPLLRQHLGLCRYANDTKSRVTLGSIGKSHLNTHWKKSRFPTPFGDICYPFAMHVQYYDPVGEAWASQMVKPSFVHLFPLKLPTGSPYLSLQHLGIDWPTSNTILATQTQCPEELTAHEYMAWQGLLLGDSIRWPTLLRELGSTNLNFSTDSTAAIVSRLCLQAGPATSNGHLRNTHAIFSDTSFCHKLLEQVDIRLEAIQRNWREAIQLDVLVTILLKVATMSSDDEVSKSVTNMLLKASSVAYGWSQNQETSHAGAEVGPATFAIWAALLYKRTFYALLALHAGPSASDLTDFIMLSIKLQDHLVGDFNVLPHILRNAILRDLYLAWNGRHQLQALITSDSRVLLDAVEVFWPVPDTTSHHLYLTPFPWWIGMTLCTEYGMQHHVHYNTLDGTLLIDGQQLGTLPLEYRQSPILEELLGTQSLRALPSPLPGMSLVVSRQLPFNYRIHLAYYDDNLVIRAEQRGSNHHRKFFQLFPRSLFFTDLPASLTDNCFHWVDLATKTMEIRQQEPFRSKVGNWRLDLRTRRATRNHGSTLVDPNSPLAQSVAQNFHHFEYRRHMTIYQPPNGSLRVELQRLELHFVVYKNGLLLCPQLGAVIAESRFQNIGTWHGLRSKLVMRSLSSTTQLSVLVPIGKHLIRRDGPHVSIVVDNDGGYLKFDVNTILGRLDCATEPLMLYYRAMWHALTAHFLPDSLTGRTGVEEALQYLTSGAYQPWTPLSPTALELLLKISELSPTREYYPPTLKKMEVVGWNPDMTVHMQDDRYRRVVNGILLRNTELLKFSPPYTSDTLSSSSLGLEHLENRALSRTFNCTAGRDRTYIRRDGPLVGEARTNIMSIANTLSVRTDEAIRNVNLASSLANMTVIGGYVKTFDVAQITDILEADLGLNWGPLVLWARENSEHKFRMTFLFSLLSLSYNANMKLLQTILTFTLQKDLEKFDLPKHSSYNGAHMYDQPNVEKFMALIDEAKVPYMASRNTKSSQVPKRKLEHEVEATKACRMLVESLLAQWPSRALDYDQLAAKQDKLLSRDEALNLMLPEWNRHLDNYEFLKHIEEVQTILSRYPEDDRADSHLYDRTDDVHASWYPTIVRAAHLPHLRDILGHDVSALAPARKEREQQPTSAMSRLLNVVKAISNAGNHMPKQLRELDLLVAPYACSDSMVHRRYGAELKNSIKAEYTRLSQPTRHEDAFNPTKLASDLSAAKASLDFKLKQLSDVLQQGHVQSKWLTLAGLWPKVTILTLLREIRSTSGSALGKGVQKVLIDLGLAITTYQRLLRIQDNANNRRSQQMLDERANLGHTNWSPEDHIDWLLLEIDSDILIRPEQVDVALATIAPQTGQNSVVQLLMGKGKTSCILPMVALKLTSKNLVRIVVPRPLLLQSAQVMQAKLGGLLDREILHVPFSRKTPTNLDLMHTYGQLHAEVQTKEGIVLALPEHILSFKLSGIQRLCDRKDHEAALMIKMQEYFDQHARDVLDECDITLGIRTQLIYPSGSQSTVDGHPSRWQTVQGLLSLVFDSVDELVREFPNSIEVVPRVGVPLIYFLRVDVEEYLTKQLLRKICKGQTAILPMEHFPHSSQQDIFDFISQPTVDIKVTARVYSMFGEKRHLVDVVLHLRGMFVHSILLSTLKKFWNVQYGLHPARDPIAVPYQAKGVPSPTSEWGHPDVAIVLTCLSFYYEGLSMAQFKQAFSQLAKSNEPSIEYGSWVAEGVPEAFRNYNGINMEDSEQLRELHRHVKYKVCLLDSYLNSFVFPQHAKQFSRKLSASGSDLVLYDPKSTVRAATTGFSGTNDTRHQLPMTIKQNDLPQLAHSNAEVLAYLLEDRNRRYVRMVDPYTKHRLSEEGLLRKLQQPGDHPEVHSRIRILIDAGAQIKEQDNLGLARAWLEIDTEAKAAVYFDKSHRAMVAYRKGANVPLVATPFAKSLEDCVVYIDESHCRGTDLKLPPRAKAAVTLGPHLTKDAFVQAVMRMRLLGISQSVTIVSPAEAHQGILDAQFAAKSSPRGPLSTLDVIRWLLQRSCSAIDQLEPLYFNQNLDYLQRTQAKLDHPDILENKDSRTSYLKVVLVKELRSLKQLYEPKYQQAAADVEISAFATSLQTYAANILRRKQDFQSRGLTNLSTTLEEVEQEREMEFELESVREVQPPVYFEALEIAGLHKDIKKFALTGKLRAGSDAAEPMFLALQKTALGLKHGTIAAANMPARLSVSSQFLRTVSVDEANDDFLRPCNWLLWSRHSGLGLLVSPEEANLLVPILRSASMYDSTCNLIVYSAPLTRHMLHFNDLDYYAIPRLPSTFKAPDWLKVELGIFAGRLYFDWDEYEIIMSYLGMQASDKNAIEYVPTQSKEAFATKPLALLHDWLAVRRKGLDLEHTPIGFITTGKPLRAQHAFFSALDQNQGDGVGVQLPKPSTPQDTEDAVEESDDDEDYSNDHLYQHDEVDDPEEFHDAKEDFDTEGNTFFDGKAYEEGNEDDQ